MAVYESAHNGLRTLCALEESAHNGPQTPCALKESAHNGPQTPCGVKTEMLGKSSWWAVFAGAAVLSAGSATEKQDRVWKPYTNTQWGYCVSYPSRWLKGDAFDGAGIYVKTGLKRYSRPVGEIDIGVVSGGDATAVHATPVNLVDDLETHFDGLKKFERAEAIEILDKREMKLVGNAALFTKDRYYDPQERAKWVEEIIFMRHKGALYRLELECRDDQLARFERVFQTFVSTFRFDCGAAQ